VQFVGGGETAGEESAPERGVRDEPDAELAAGWENLRLGVTGPQRVLGLHGGDRMDGVRAANRLGRRLTEADVTDLALVDQLRQRADRLLDRHVGIDAVLVVEVDILRAEPRE